MRVLVGCECSGRVRQAFRDRGHDAWSCDILPAEDNSPFHLQCDVLTVLNDGWDMGIFHPDCTYLCRQGRRWIGHPKHPDRLVKTEEALVFFKTLYAAPIPKLCLENPVGILNSQWMKPTQIIQPYQFGHDYSKKTCLWLKGLPPLQPTNIVELTYITTPNGRRFTRGWYEMPRKSTERSRTFQGIANAMAEQWSVLL